MTHLSTAPAGRQAGPDGPGPERVASYRMTAPIDRTLLPRTTRVDGSGRATVGGCDLEALAAEHGTPLYVYDEEDLRARCREYVDAFGANRVAYAGKAFLCVAMARLIDEEGLLLDVATGGELGVAMRASFPAERVIFHGNNKSEEELRLAFDVGVGRVVADSFDEINRLEALVSAGRSAPAVLVRVTPGVEAHTHEHIETGAEDSKFGLSLERGEALAAVQKILLGGKLHFAGLHCHIGSQVFRLDSYARALTKMAVLVHTVESLTGASVEEVNLGGGLGVRYVRGDAPPPIAVYAKAAHDGLAAALADAGVASSPIMMVEPGRSIAGPPGLTLYRIGTMKEIPGLRTYVAVDGGMSDNLRPALYGAEYEAFAPGRVMADRPLVATVAGKHCEQGDVLVRDAHLPADLRVGDVIATPCTGAYGASMASNYNRTPRPAVVFVRGGDSRVVVRRETVQDLLRLDVG